MKTDSRGFASDNNAGVHPEPSRHHLRRIGPHQRGRMRGAGKIHRVQAPARGHTRRQADPGRHPATPARVRFEHHAQPRVISITQPTELGTLYSLDEIRAIAALLKNTLK
jgi:hypothetical protein